MKKLRKVEEIIAQFLMIFSTLLIGTALVLLLLAIIFKGLPSLNLDMITKTPKGGFYLGKEGGILNAIAGSLYLGFGAVFLALLVGLPIVFYLNIYIHKNTIVTNFVRFCFDVLWGIPSIVYGAFGFIIMI